MFWSTLVGQRVVWTCLFVYIRLNVNPSYRDTLPTLCNTYNTLLYISWALLFYCTDYQSDRLLKLHRCSNPKRECTEHSFTWLWTQYFIYILYQNPTAYFIARVWTPCWMNPRLLFCSSPNTANMRDSLMLRPAQSPHGAATQPKTEETPPQFFDIANPENGIAQFLAWPCLCLIAAVIEHMTDLVGTMAWAVFARTQSRPPSYGARSSGGSWCSHHEQGVKVWVCAVGKLNLVAWQCGCLGNRCIALQKEPLARHVTTSALILAHG